MKFWCNKTEQPEEEPVTTDDTGFDAQLILYNDDYNTFDYVIEHIQEICELELHQAEQITMLAHYKGKATCRKGVREKLEPMCAKLDDKGIMSEVK